MGALLDIFIEAPMGGAVLGWTAFGLLGQVVLVVSALRWAKRDTASAEAIERLAADGELQRARIRAREASRDLAPLLATLSGEAFPSLTPHPQPSVWALIIVSAPTAVLVAGSFVPPSAETALALSAGAAVLLPGNLLAARIALLVRRRSGREIRRACVSLLEDNARAEVERTRSAALRRRTDGARRP